ncbi:hypothetical protein L596_016902 [Steinernema carpocapsae]|uniref:C-type lectin domain-containing protein n=1 Tax=Steinernema carpocapsae TaxID=34508 RepID=A0A4U5NL49_STECR|nr:hypothetical protein L596_016902 [Steinernema carpocapsae]
MDLTIGPFNYSYWAAGEPSKKGDCLMIDGLTGLWKAADCNKKMSFVCLSPASEDATTPGPEENGCPSGAKCLNGYAYHGTGVYFLDWNDAEKYCVDKFGGHLACS